MNKTTQPEVDRRVDPRSQMTDYQFKQYTVKRMDEGEKQFKAIEARLGVMAGHLEKMSVAMVENTALTQKAVDLSEATARDTAGLVAIEKFGKSAADVVKTSARGMNWTSKLLFRVLIIVSIGAAIWHGKWPDWKQILEALK